MTHTILYVDSRAPELDIEQAVGAEVELINARQKSADAIDRRDWERCDAVVTARMPIDSAVIPRLKRARIVVRHGVGFDVVDLEGCGAAGIPVCNVPDYGTTEVADSAWSAYLKGDRGVFTRRAVRLLDHGEAREIAALYDNDDAFRDNVNRYIHDFEAMLRQILSLRDGSPLGVTLLSSDMGKLYVILAQAIERLRT